MGIVNGIGENKFAPETPINREQMAVIILNYAKSIGLDFKKLEEEKIFKDNGHIRK